MGSSINLGLAFDPQRVLPREPAEMTEAQPLESGGGGVAFSVLITWREEVFVFWIP